MTRLIWRPLIVLFLLIILLIGALLASIVTEKGSQTIWSMAQSAVGEDLNLGELKGPLISPFQISGFSLNNAAQKLTIGKIGVTWDLRKLINKQLHIKNIVVEELGILRHQTATKKSPTSPFKLEQLLLPVTIQIDKASLTALSIKTAPDAEPLVTDHLQFGLTLDKQELVLKSATLSSPQLDLATAARIDLQDDTASGNVTWNARIPDFAASKGIANITGSLKDLQISILSEAPYTLAAIIQIEDVLNQPETSIAIKDIDVRLSKIASNLPPIGLRGLANAQSPMPGGAILFQTALALSNVPQIGNAKTALSGSFADSRIRIDQWRLSPDNNATEINGQGNILLAPQSDIQFDLDWKQLLWPLTDATVFSSSSGNAKVTGSFESIALAINTDIEVPVSAKRVQGVLKVDLSSTQPIVDATLSALSLSYPDLANPLISDAEVNVSVSGQLPLLQAEISLLLPDMKNQPNLSSRASIDLTNVEQPALNIRGDWQNLQWPLVVAKEADILVRSQLGEITVRGTPQAFTARFNTRINGQGSVEGEVAYAPDNFNLKTRWRNLDYRAVDQHFRSDAGKLEVSGTPDKYQLELDGALMVNNKAVTLKTTGQGNRQSIAIDQLTANLLDGEITGNAQFQWSPQVNGQIQLLNQNIDPGQWFPEWHGRINGPIVGAATIVEGVVSIEHLDTKLQGELRTYPVNFQLMASSQDHDVDVKLMSLKSGDTTINARGQLSDRLDFSWNLKSENLASLHPQLSGQIAASGVITGQPDKPVIKADIDGDAITYGTNQINALVARVLLDTTDTKNSDVNVQFAGRIGDISVNNALLTAKGLMREHQIDLATDTSIGRLSANIDSRLSQNFKWSFDLTQTNIDTSEWGEWKLSSPVSGSLSQGDLSMSSACFHSRERELCAEADLKGGDLLATTRFSNLALSDFIAPYTSDFELDGKLNGSGNVKLAAGKNPVGNITITTTPGELRSAANKESADKAQQLIAFESGEILVGLTDGQVDINFNLPLAGNDMLNANAIISGSSSDWLSRSVRGNIETQIGNINFIEQLVPGVEKLSGRVKGAMTMQGVLAKPVFSGTLGFYDGGVSLTAPEIQLEKIRITLDGDPQTGMKLNGTAFSGGGELSLSGLVNLSKSAPVADITLVGENVQLMNTAQAEVFVSPNLTLQLNDKSINVTGEVVIPTATIEIKSIPKSAIKPSNDQVIVTETVTPAGNTADYKLSARVKTSLGDKVNFSGFGLTGRLGGEVTSVEQPGKPSQINGEVKVLDGRYQAYGQNLTIETGRLLFAGEGSTNPALDLRASRQPTEDVKVGVTARGNLQQPDFSLYSTPSMTERNRLSYLILGRGADQTSTGEKSELGQLALALGLKRSSGVTGSIGEKLGVDQIGVEAEPGSASEQESFVIGKYLTPKLYLRYGIGLFEPINTLRLQYSINDRWKIVTESSDKASSGDVQYSIDR